MISSARTDDYYRSLPGASNLSDADLWEHYVANGLSPEQAQIHVLRRRSGRQGVADNTLAPKKSTSPGQAALLGAGRTATSGFVDELLGALEAMRGPDPQNTAQHLFGAAGGRPLGQAFDSQRYQQTRDQVRELQSQAVADHPWMSLGGGAVGTFINPLNHVLGPATRAMGAMRQGITTGAVLGAAQGAGEGTNGLDRLGQALKLAAAGAAIGGVGGVANKLWRGVFGKAPPAKPSEDVIRRGLVRLKFSPAQADQAMAIWREGGILPPAPKRLPVPAEPPAPPVVRAGETITQIAPKGFEVTGTRATPPAPSTPNFWEQVYGPRVETGMPDIGRGQTVPYYPRGGVVEQAFGTPPVSGNPASTLVPQQVQLIKQFLHGVTPTDLASRLDVIRAIGIPLPADAEAQLLPMLTGGH